MIAGQSGTAATLMALRTRDRDGSGQVIELSLFEPMFTCLGPQIANRRLKGREPHRMGSLSELSASRKISETADGGFVALSASTQAMAKRVFRVIGRPDMITDPRFSTNSDRIDPREECDAAVADSMRSLPRDELVGIIAGVAELDGNPYITDREVIVEMPDSDMASFPMQAIPLRLSFTPGVIKVSGPALGTHSVAILKALGFSRDRIDDPVARNIVEEPTKLTDATA